MKSLSGRWIRGFWLPVGLLLVALALACGGGAAPPPAAPSAPAAANPTAAPTSPSAQVPAAASPVAVPTVPPPAAIPIATWVPPTIPDAKDRTLTVYSGRSQTLVHPLLVAFGEQTGVDIRVKYAGSASTAATLLEEGDNTPADVVFMQDPGSLGILADSGALAPIPQASLDKVDPRFRSPAGLWLGTSGRARTVIYNTEAINPETDLPPSILDFTGPEWRGRVGWAPRNGSFQAFVTALRLTEGEDAARDWLIGIRDNDPIAYPNNVTTVSATAAGEVDVGFVNHYYLERFLEEHGEGFGARNHYIGNGDPGALVLVAGVGILAASENKDVAEEFVEFLLAAPAQTYFAQQIKEYPVSAGVEPVGDLPAMESLNPPDVDLGNLSDLEGTLRLLRETDVLP